MATIIARRPAQRPDGKGEPPVARVSQNLSKPDREALTPLNFRVPGEFHRSFKIYAAEHGMSMVELLQESFEAYRRARHLPVTK